MPITNLLTAFIDAYSSSSEFKAHHSAIHTLPLLCLQPPVQNLLSEYLGIVSIILSLALHIFFGPPDLPRGRYSNECFPMRFHSWHPSHISIRPQRVPTIFCFLKKYSQTSMRSYFIWPFGFLIRLFPPEAFYFACTAHHWPYTFFILDFFL